MGEIKDRRDLQMTLGLQLLQPSTTQEGVFRVDPCLRALWDWANRKIRLSDFPNSLFVSSKTDSVFHFNRGVWNKQMEIDSYLEWLRQQNNGPLFSAVAIAQICEPGARPLTLSDVQTLVSKHMLPGAYLLLCDNFLNDDVLRHKRLTRMRSDLHLRDVIFDDNLPPPYCGYMGKKYGTLSVV